MADQIGRSVRTLAVVNNEPDGLVPDPSRVRRELLDDTADISQIPDDGEAGNVPVRAEAAGAILPLPLSFDRAVLIPPGGEGERGRFSNLCEKPESSDGLNDWPMSIMHREAGGTHVGADHGFVATGAGKEREGEQG